MNDQPKPWMMTSVSHLAGPAVCVGGRVLQRCAICGEKLVDSGGEARVLSYTEAQAMAEAGVLGVGHALAMNQMIPFITSPAGVVIEGVRIWPCGRQLQVENREAVILPPGAVTDDGCIVLVER